MFLITCWFHINLTQRRHTCHIHINKSYSVYFITLSWSLSLIILFFLLSFLIIPSLDWKTPYLTHSSKQIILCLFHHTTVLQPSLITYIYWLFNGEGDQLTVRSSEATPSPRWAFCPPAHEWFHHEIGWMKYSQPVYAIECQCRCVYFQCSSSAIRWRKHADFN